MGQGGALTDVASESVVSSTLRQSRAAQPVPDEMITNQASTIMTSVSSKQIIFCLNQRLFGVSKSISFD